MKFILLVSIVSLLACDEETGLIATDQKLRHDLFCECLKSVPRSPEVMDKSDWSKVVGQCAKYAYHASKRVVPRDSQFEGIVKDAAARNLESSQTSNNTGSTKAGQ